MHILRILVLLSARQDPAQPAHSVHGEAFNEGPRQAAVELAGMGNVRLEITAGDARVQTLFNQGMGQLHGFYYFEAERSFRQIAAIEPDCAMAYWGMAMANINNEKRAKGFLEKADKRKANASKREQMWIQLLLNYYQVAATEKEKRARAYIKGLEAILADFPDETEAKAFLAWALWYHKDKGLPIQSHQAVESLISDVLRSNPMHPGAHHYRIHLWDDEKAARALPSVERYGPSSPGIAHAWHMPGHVYSKLHRYGEAAWQQEASARVDHAHMIRYNIMPYQIHNFGHNNQWLVQNLAHVGRVRDAVAVAENLIAIPRHPKHNKVGDSGSCARSGRSRLFETLTHWELWDELLARAETTLAPMNSDEDRALRARALGAAHIARGDVEKARELLEEIEALAKVGEVGPSSEEKDEKKKEEAKKARESRSKGVRNAIAELEGRLKLAAGQEKEGLEDLKKAGLRKAALAQLHLRAGDKEEAEKTAKAAADGARGEPGPLAAYIEILEALGKEEEAARRARDLMDLSAGADTALPLFERLAPFLEKQGLQRPEAKKPALDLPALGPLLWNPPVAPSWILQDAEGRDHGSALCSGGPLLLIFYLGAKCPHCVEQLKKFSGLTEDFRKSNISILAISTESTEVLRLNREAGKGDYPFPLLSDGDLKVFKGYRCFDDFERIPLHGTFLIDSDREGAARIRWQEISFTPFMEAEFLLEESRRLLALPK